MTRLLRLAALALAVAGFAAQAATAADRPFKGSASGAIVALDPNTHAGIAWYTGQATHLGRFTRTEYFQLDGAGGISGTMAFTAANGDELYLDFTGQFLSPTTVLGAYQFAGGTGRFRDAAGAADFTAVLGAEGRVEVIFDGTIRY